MGVLSGKSISNGVGIGRIVKVESIKEPSKGMVLNPSKEIENFDDCLKDLRNELLDLTKEYEGSEYFIRLSDAANNEIWIADIKKYVAQMSMNLLYSIKTVSEKMGGYYLDNGYRLIRIISKLEPLKIDYDEEVVIVSRRLNMSDVMRFNEEFIKGIITEESLPKEESISIAHVYDIDTKKLEGEIAIVDSDKSLVLIDQSDEIIEKYRQQIQINEIQTGGLTKYIGLETKTKDLKSIELSGILSKISDYDIIKSNDSDSITILNENMFMQGDATISLDAQISIFDKAFDRFKNKYLNVVLSYSNNSVFRDRLKALIMSSKDGNIRIILDNIHSINMLRTVKTEINHVEKKLVEEKIEFGNYEMGVVIDTPEGALMIGHYLELVDFIVVHSDELIKNIVGRKEDSDYSVYNIAFLKLLRRIAVNTQKTDKWFSLYGKDIDDENMILLLIGIGVSSFIIKSNNNLALRKHIIKHEVGELTEIAKRAVQFESEQDLKEYLDRHNF